MTTPKGVGRVGCAETGSRASTEPAAPTLDTLDRSRVGGGLGPSGFDPARLIALVANAANEIAWQAGVGGMETAGSIVSYLAAHPEQINPFLAGEASPVDWPVGWHEQGCLTWQGQDGKIYSPENVRLARMTPNARAFVEANAVSPIASGEAVGEGGEGSIYTLQDGKVFRLTQQECASIGEPRWSESSDSDGSPEGRDAQRLDGEAARARAEGIAQGNPHD